MDHREDTMSMVHDVKIGQSVRIQDSDGEWHDAVADSGVEGTHHGGGRKVHDFPIIWVKSRGNDGKMHRMPWPIEHVAVT